MLRSFLILLLAAAFAGCNKEKKAAGREVAIYELRTFTRTTNTSTNPYTVSVTGANWSDTPLVRDADIAAYDPDTRTFTLRRDIRPQIRNYSSNKGFVVTVDGDAVYFGLFHPSYLSSIAFGIATIDPILTTDRALRIQFAEVTGQGPQLSTDLRNHPRILDALRASGRLR